MEIEKFISIIGSRTITDEQIRDLKKIVELARDFHRMAEIPTKNWKISENTVVLESGHQPNFLPYAGVWRKVFLLDYFCSKLKEFGRDSLPVFGFFDFNLCTAKWLFQNKVPAANKEGFVTIGFRRSSGVNMWKRFNSIDKPSEEEWEREVQKIYNIYKKDKENRENLEIIIEEMWKSYELGNALSDVNAILFSRLCVLLGLNVLFFRYSDVQRAKVFIEEWKKVLSRLEDFNRLHNEVVEKKGLHDVGFVEPNSAPFWYHCECGGKVQMFLTNSFYSGECPVCGEKYRIESIEEEFENLSPRAVMRNVVFSEGLRTSLFVSGAGGGLRYGTVSNEISFRLGFNVPITVVWLGKDYHLGVAHRSLVREITKAFDMDLEDLTSEERAISKLAAKRRQLAKAVGSGDVKSEQKYLGQYRYSDTQLRIAESAFAVTPSILDILVSSGFDGVVDAWRKAMAGVEIKEGEFYRIERDVVYGDERLPKLYDVIRVLKERSKEIDPLGILGGA